MQRDNALARILRARGVGGATYVEAGHEEAHAERPPAVPLRVPLCLYRQERGQREECRTRERGQGLAWG